MVHVSKLTRVRILDFDGCVGSPVEEALFTLPRHKHDSAFIQKISYRHRLNLNAEYYYSARYIAMQAALSDLDIPCRSGPIAHLTNSVVPYYILTARSDRFSTVRMMEFIENRSYLPIKIMQVDTLNKSLMLGTLLERYPEALFEFWDDNLKHTEAAKMLRSERVEVNRVDNDMARYYMEASTLYEQLLDHTL